MATLAQPHTNGGDETCGTSTSSTKELTEQEEAMGAETATGCCQGTSLWMVLLRLTLCILAGIIFGWSLEKTRGQFLSLFKLSRPGKQLCVTVVLSRSAWQISSHQDQ